MISSESEIDGLRKQLTGIKEEFMIVLKGEPGPQVKMLSVHSKKVPGQYKRSSFVKMERYPSMPKLSPTE
jgi:hypothetical protein